MSTVKKKNGAVGILKILNPVVNGPKEAAKAAARRDAELNRQDDLMGEAVALILATGADPQAKLRLRGHLDWVLERHLDRLEEDARQGTYSQARRSLQEISSTSKKLLGILRTAPIEALSRLRVMDQNCHPVPDWEIAGGQDLPDPLDREIFETARRGIDRDPSGWIRRLAALVRLAEQATDQLMAESQKAEGAKSIREAQIGRTLDLELFEDCTRILGPMERLAFLTAVAGLLHEAATGERVSPSWGGDYEMRAHRWWRAVGRYIGMPLARVPEAKREMVQQGLICIPSVKQRGAKKATAVKQGKAVQSKAR